MLVLIYMLAAMLITPFAYDWVNRRITVSGRASNLVKNWPAWAINVIICAMEALIVCVMPGGWGLTLANVLAATTLIYFFNQVVFHTMVKWVSKARKAL